LYADFFAIAKATRQDASNPNVSYLQNEP